MTPHEESLLLARGCETWRHMAEKWISVAIDMELRLLAAQKMLEAQMATTAELRATVTRLEERLAEAQEEIACRSGVVR